MKLAIVGTGPGCTAVTEADLDGRTVCAVNQAVNVLPRVDILAFQDPLEMVLMTLSNFEFAEVWCNLHSIRKARAAFPWALVREGAELAVKMRLGRWVKPEAAPPSTMPPAVAEILRANGVQPPPTRREDGKVFERYGFVIPSMHMVLMTAGVLGYRDVLVFGAEMQGSGSPTRAFSANPDGMEEIRGFQEEAIPAYANRWKRERWLFGVAQRHLWTYYRCRVRRVVRPLAVGVPACGA